MDYNNIYNINIFERYTDLKKSNKKEFDNNDLWKIFEYYSCMKLTEEYKTQFYEYDDIDPTFKEINRMSRNDTGIDCCNLIDFIVQCKLRKNSLTWKECSTFIGSQNIFSKELNKVIIRWPNLIITRNDDCTLSEHLLERQDLFIDKLFNKQKLLIFCEDLITNPPTYPIYNTDFKLRDYQIEAIDLVTKSKKNVIISLPTGTGKNSVIIYSFKDNMKYLILVPRIILMDQLKKEVIKHNPQIKNKIQLIGDNNNVFDENKLITICVFNSVHLIENYCSNFEKIFIDEAHHINRPAIYYDNLDDISVNSDEPDEIDDSIDETDSEDEIDETDSEDEIDDSEDELVNVKNYTQIIKSLVKYNNNVYLSATIDKTDNFEYYNKDIREMIDRGYLCDYTIHVPIFNDSPTNNNICEHLLKNYKNIIIYCNSQKEGKIINKLMNDFQLNSSEYIDCNTSRKKRNIIIEKYKNGDIPFLVNVRILVEGFDAPITKGVCFLHLSTNKTTLIQIIGRALRLHPTKTIANIILPFSSNEDEKSICNFLKVMANNDSRIRKAFESKQLGGYISIETVNDDDDEENENIEFKYSKIYSSMGILQNGVNIWMNKLEEVKKYIDDNEKRPLKRNKNKEIKTLGIWLSTQRTNYKNKKNIMKDKNIIKIYEDFIKKYKNYFQSNEEIWLNNLKLVEDYIVQNNKSPSQIAKNKYIGILGRWLSTQKINYKNKEKIMKDTDIVKKYEEFIEKYKEYFQSNKESWLIQLKQVEDYIIQNNKTPSAKHKNKEIKTLGKWLSHQQTNYKNKEHIMKDTNIIKIYEEFIEKYKTYFQSNEEIWLNNLKLVEDYITQNNKAPSTSDKNKSIKLLGSWLSHQQTNYKNKEHIMKDTNIMKIYEEFIEKSKEYFQLNEKSWLNNLKLVENYIIKNNKKPYEKDKNKEIKILGQWLGNQKQNYKNKERIMKDANIRKIYEEFIVKHKI